MYLYDCSSTYIASVFLVVAPSGALLVCRPFGLRRAVPQCAIFAVASVFPPGPIGRLLIFKVHAAFSVFFILCPDGWEACRSSRRKRAEMGIGKAADFKGCQLAGVIFARSCFSRWISRKLLGAHHRPCQLECEGDIALALALNNLWQRR